MATKEDNPRGLYDPREHSFADVGTIYGAAFNGCPVPSLVRADGGTVEDRPHGLIVTDHTGRAVLWLSSLGAKINGSAIESQSFTRKGLSKRPHMHHYVHSFTYDDRTGSAGILLSTTELSDSPIDDLLLGEPDDLASALAELGEDFVAWCRECNFPVKPGRGAAAAMFLTDARFGWGQRARIPRRLNDLARDHLPGNHYRLWESGHFAEVVEIDQTSAHHNAAATELMPDSLTFGSMGHGAPGIKASYGSPAWNRLVKRPGLFAILADVDARAVPRRALRQLEDIPTGGGRMILRAWSSELEALLAEPGVTPLGIVSAATSPRSNPGVANYARWALSELERNSGNPRRMKWLKAFLLTAYGAVAARPKTGYRWSTQPSRKGTGLATRAEVGGMILDVYQFGKRMRRKQPAYVNVFIRGIIEAAVRTKTIMLARELDGDTNVRPISEYADAIFVEILKREDECRLFALNAVEDRKTNYDPLLKDEKSGSAVRATSRVSRSPRVSSPLPAPTRLTGSVRLAAEPRTHRRLDDGSDVWTALQPHLSEGSSTETTVPLTLRDGWRVKRKLTDFVMLDSTNWTAAEDEKRPGTPRRSRPEKSS